MAFLFMHAVYTKLVKRKTTRHHQFKTLKTAYAAIKGIELMCALRKGQAANFSLTGDIRGEACIVGRAFGIGPSALTEAVAMLAQNFDSQTV